jgi:hypothetical protein
MFPTPPPSSLDRNTFLTCRTPLLRNGDNVDAAPDCLDVDQMFTSCPAVVTFLGGTP